MSSTVTFIAPSGAPASGTVMEDLDIPGNISGANRIGFFGAGGPEGVPFAIILNSYQDKTFITNASGQNLGNAPYGLLASGELTNNKFVTTATVVLPLSTTVAVSSVPEVSGTLLIRFEPSGGAAQTQNGVLRCVNLNASSGVDDIEGLVANMEVQAFEAGGKDSSFTTIAGTTLDNRLFLEDRDTADTVHDYHVSLSVTPTAIGERIDFGFLFVVEFL